MTTIKPYTDLQQSKKLAEILSVESADGYWFKGFPAQPYMVYTKGTPNLGKHISCWSLAALLEVLPKIQGLKPILDLEECSIQYSGIDLYITAGNLVDACYEMILKLNELKLL